jgi:hypothetical protein
MMLKLQEKYLPLDYEDLVFVDLLAHKQGNTTMDEYTHRFHEFTIRSRLTETERQTFTHYKAGLREDISRELITVWVTSLDEVYQLALRLEQQAKLTSARRSSSSWNHGSPHGNFPATSRLPQGDRTSSKVPIPTERFPTDQGERCGQSMGEGKNDR